MDRWRAVLPDGAGSWKSREGRALVHHVFSVAAGHESLAFGEAEARHQVRAATGTVRSRHPRSVLRTLLEDAARAADEVYRSVPSSRSIASIAAKRLMEQIGRSNPRVLVVGFGTVGRQVAEILAPAAALTVVYHRRPPDDAFLRAAGARAVRVDQMSGELAASDAVVTAAKFGNHGLTAADLPRDRPLVLVDLGMPRNIDPDVRELPNVRLIDLQELHGSSRGRSTDAVTDPRVAELADRCSERLERLLLEPWIAALRRAAEEVRQDELANARPHLGSLDPAQEIAIERLTRRLVDRLLLPPTERMRGLPAGADGDRQRRFAVDLLRPRSPDP